MEAKKHFGQNFLINEKIIQRIVSEVDAKNNDLIIEIGPGKGALTRFLKKYNSFLIAYELDKDLDKYLREFYDKKTKIIYQDILVANIKQDINYINYNNIFLVGNLPYYITTPIIEKITEENLSFQSFIIMVQKEVAERFMAKPGTKEYGYFTLYLQFYYEVIKICDVSKESFQPIPKVDSTVLKLIPKATDNKIDEIKYFNYLKRCFQHKRKTLKNNLINSEWEIAKKVLKKYDINENVRAEQLDGNILMTIYREIH